MSLMRIFGVVLSLVFFAVVFYRLRSYSKNRFDVIILSIFSFTMLLVGLFPDLVNLPAELLSLDKIKGGRLLTLLIVSSLTLWLLFINERGKMLNQTHNFDKLLRLLAVERFLEKSKPLQSGSILLVIPAYNEKDNLRQIIPKIPMEIMGSPIITLIVDDGSIDNTEDLDSEFDVCIARNLINRGGGAALRVGFDIALYLESKVVVTMDGDGQHQIEDLNALVEPILMGKSDLVVGSRLLGQMERYSKLRYWGVVIFGKLISLLLGKRITDPASGFRSFNLKVLKKCVLTQDQYHTAELIIEASKKGLCIQEVPIIIKKRISGKSKKGRDFVYAIYFMKTIFKTWFR